MKFSERYGHKKARDAVQLDSMDVGLRTSLWNVLRLYIWNHVQKSLAYQEIYLSVENDEIQSFCTDLWMQYFKQPLDDLDDEWETVVEEIKEYFFSCKWYEVYDFIEFAAGHFPYSAEQEFMDECNCTLVRELSAYRLVNGSIVKITDQVEIGAIDDALDKAKGPVRTHLQRALELLADRNSPDYRNSIKESISAVESLVAATLGEKGTLGQLVKRLEDEIGLHPALHKAFSNLYGYTSDEDGIRHAILESETVGFDEAKFFIVICSAFVNFVQSKVSPNVATLPALPE